jgi:hypothetical protein
VQNFVVPLLLIVAVQAIANGQSTERPLTKFKAVVHPTNGGLPRKAFYGDFTVKGPIKETLVALPNDIGEVVTDSTGKLLFGMGGHELYLLDLANEKGTKLVQDGIPRLSWTMGLSYDTKRSRVLVATLEGKGGLYSYVHKTGTWSVIGSFDDVDVTAIAYLESSDRIFAIAAPGNAEKRKAVLYEYDAESGKLIQHRLINLPIVGDFIDRGLQLIAVDDSLVFIQMPKSLKAAEAPIIDVIDPKTGNIEAPIIDVIDPTTGEVKRIER